jgi:hypothetical protein
LWLLVGVVVVQVQEVAVGPADLERVLVYL